MENHNMHFGSKYFKHGENHHVPPWKNTLDIQTLAHSNTRALSLLTVTPCPPSSLSTLKKISWDFPGGAVVKNPPANARDTGSNPGPGRSHMPQSN